MILSSERPTKKLIIGLGLLLTAATLLFVSASQAFASRAGLVVKHGNGRVITKCIYFSESSISGTELLRRSGLQHLIVTTGWGDEVRQIDNEGNPDNLGRYEKGKWVYWAYYHLKGGKWQYDGSGAGNHQVRDGDVEGWAWGPGSYGSGSTPPVVTFNQICPTPISSPTSNKAAPSPSAASKSTSSSPTSPSADSGVAETGTNESGGSDSSEISDEELQEDEETAPDHKKSKKKDKNKSFWNNLMQDENHWLRYAIFLAIITILVSLILFYKVRKSQPDK